MFLITNIFCDLIMLNAFKTHTKVKHNISNNYINPLKRRSRFAKTPFIIVMLFIYIVNYSLFFCFKVATENI